MKLIRWCLEHEQAAPPGATHCPFVYWVEARHGLALAKEASEACWMTAGVVEVVGE